LARLRERADSYERDARVLHDDGDHAMSAAYRAIANELRKCADEIETTEGG
jgi:hypothetical protein